MRNTASLTLLGHGLQTAVLNTVIALGITAFGKFEFGVNLLCSQFIGLSIWVLIDGARLALIRDERTQWRRLFWIVPASVVLGYALGTQAAYALLGYPTFSFWTQEPRMAIGFLILSLIAGAAITYYFMSREQLAAANEETALATAKAETAQRQAAESQLKLLQTQLEPHMLFNTLANLRVLIGSNPVAATEMLDRLNAYLRATLSASRATTQTLETEFERLRDYLELIAVRMGPRLQYSLELSPELARLPVPTLLLQPLVENAIRHGLEPKIEGGRITVRARQALGQLTLEVQDSGIGLPGGRTVTEGFGLTQVRERLASAYGGAATLDLHADETQGTQVRITYPIAA